MATWLKSLAQPNIIPPEVPILYVLAIVPIAIFFGFGPSILVCVLSMLAYDLFFIPPVYRMNISDIINAPILIIFLIVGILFSYLASDLRKKNRVAVREINARKQSEAELTKYKNHLEDLVEQRTTELEETNQDLKAEIAGRKKVEEKLRASERRWATTLSSIGDAVIATDINGRITFMNAAAEALTGWIFFEAENKPIAEVFDIINEHTRQKAENPVLSVLKQGIVVGLANHTILIRKDKTEIFIDDSGAPIKDEAGKITGVVLIFRDITEQKQLEEAVIYERDKLNNILNSMEDGVYIVDKNYNIQYVNPAIEAYFGPVQNRKCYQYFHNQLQVCPWCRNPEIFTGKHIHWELHFSKSDRIYDMIGTPLRNPDGQVFVQEILHDITERKQAEERLKRSQEIAHLGSWELDHLNNRLSWSDETYRIFGFQPQEFEATYKAFLEAVHPEDRGTVDAAYSSSITEGKDSYEIEHRVVRKSTGEIRYVYEKCQHIRDIGGGIIHSIGMVHDITAQKQAESKNRQLSAIVESSDDAIIGKTLEGIITSWNKGAEKMYGYNEAEIIGKSILLLVPADRKGEIPQFLDKIRRGEFIQDFETVRVKKDGKEIPTTITISPILDERGGISGASTIARDITGRKKAEEDLKRYTTELETANKELESFSYSVSHDLRAPLRGIDGFSNALLEDYDDKLDAQGKDYLNRIRKSTQLMSQLIDDMLTLSRVSRADMRPDEVNLSEIVSSITEEMQQSQPDRETEFLIPPGLTVHGDKALLNALLRNLLENAWKFTSKRSQTRIEFGVTYKESIPVYYIKDNGIGFDMQYCDKLFKPFSRLHTRDDYPGTGIGLANVQRIIRRHGGIIWAESTVGKGSTFYFSFEK